MKRTEIDLYLILNTIYPFPNSNWSLCTFQHKVIFEVFDARSGDQPIYLLHILMGSPFLSFEINVLISFISVLFLSHPDCACVYYTVLYDIVIYNYIYICSMQSHMEFYNGTSGDWAV